MDTTNTIKHGGNTYSKIEYPNDEYASYKYPSLLCDYLCENYTGNRGLLLDIGCGKGNHMVGFTRQGFRAFGLDLELPEMTSDPFVNNTLRDIKQHDVRGGIPFGDSFFHVVFSKSLLEHLPDTSILEEVHRVLTHNGKALFMVPDYNDVFWDDPTHIHPFTKKSLSMAFSLAGFSQVYCEYFYQLPFVWRMPYLKPLLGLLRFVPNRFKYHNGKQNVLIRHGKERMILAVGVK